MIYHVVPDEQWKHALAQGFYAAPSLETEGFIHLSRAEQVNAVLQRYYKNVPGLLLLHLDENKLSAPLKYELSPSVNETFPHLFGRLNIDAVIMVTEIKNGSAGSL